VHESVDILDAILKSVPFFFLQSIICVESKLSSFLLSHAFFFFSIIIISNLN